MAVVCIIYRRRVHVWALIAGVVIFVLLYVPFIMYESGVAWVDLMAARDAVGQASSFSPASLLLSLDLLRARGLAGPTDRVGQFDRLATVLFVLSLGYALWWSLRVSATYCGDSDASRKLTGLCILALWLVVPVLVYLRSAHYLQVYYLIGQLPVHFVLIGFSLDGAQSAAQRVASRLPRMAWRRAISALSRVALPLPLLALTVWQGLFSLQFQDRRFEAESGPAQVWQIRDVIAKSRDVLASQPECHLVALSEGHSVGLSSLSLLREFISRERVLLADGRLALPVAAPCAVYLDAQPGSVASDWLVEVATPLPTVAIRAQGKMWRFFELAPQDRVRVSGALGGSHSTVTWENGLSLTGYDRGQIAAGTTLPLTLTWLFEGPAPKEVYHFGTYLLTPDSRVVAQSDGPGFDSIQWRRGDRFITWFDIALPEDLPSGKYEIGVTLYSWPAVRPAALASGETPAIMESLRLAE
jgi:hypothetical protein